MKWLTRVAVVFCVLVALLALVPFFVTLNDYIPVIESEISARLEQPVSIDNLHATAFPAPQVVIDGITIGSAEDIRVGKLSFRPELRSLLSREKLIKRVEVTDVVVSEKALGTLLALAQRESARPAAVRVERIRFDNIVVKLEQASFGPFDASVEVGGGTRPGEITMVTRDNAVKARITPEGERYRLDISARAWTPPAGPQVHFDTLDIKGIATASNAELDDVSAKLYGGALTGKMTIAWDKAFTLKGAFEVTEVEMKPLAALLSRETRLSGKLQAKPVFSAHAANSAKLLDALRMETPFTVRNGILHGFDIAQAATSLLKQSAAGGETRFDTLAGHLVMEHGAYRFTQLDIASGQLAARGNVTVSRTRALSGELKANVTGLGRAVTVPLSVAGTLDAPLLYPNAAALAGAAAGTAILGPGLGTAAGARIGEITKELFGSKKR